MDPRIPDALEAFAFVLPEGLKAKRIEWLVDSSVVGSTTEPSNRFFWHLTRGTHKAKARVWMAGSFEPVETDAVTFHVR
jgi:hypothetical protein